MLEADSLDTSLGSGISLLKGNAIFADAGMRMTADQIRVDANTNTAVATGNVVFTRGITRLLADRLEYRRTDDSFTAENIRLGSYPYFAEAQSAAGTRDEITLTKAQVFYGEPGRWQPTVTADTVVYSPGRRLRSENAEAGIGSTQFLPFPRLQQDLAQPFAAFVSIDGGFRRSLGAYLEPTVHLPLLAGLRAGADLGYYSERGLMAGPSGRYFHPRDRGRMSGSFTSGYINDHGDKGTDRLGRAVPENRAFAEWQHHQRVNENLTLLGQLNWWKDSEVVRDFRPEVFFPVQEPDTFVEAVYQGSNYFLTAFTRFQPNRFQAVQERLPEIRFDLLPIAVGAGIYERFHASAAVLREDPPGGGPTLRSDRFDAYLALERPIAPRDWVAFTPVAGGRFTHYSNTEGAVRTGNYTRWLGELGFDALLRASGTFDYKNPQWNIDGLRHLVTPRLSYRYIPEADKGRARIPRIDRESFSTYLPTLGLGDVRNIDDLRATNTLRVAIDNILQTRDGTEGTRDLLALSLANDFRFKRLPGERDVSDTHVGLALTPAPWLQVDIYQSFAPQSFTLREFNSAITLRDADVWSVRFTNNYLRRQIQDYAIDGRMRINESFDAVTRLHYDARRRRFNEQAYGVAHNLGNTWLVSYTVNLYSGRRRESNFGFHVSVETVGF